MILTGSIFVGMLLKMSETPPEPTEELLIETLSGTSKIVGVTTFDSLASNIWLAKRKMYGRSTSHVQISNVFVQAASGCGNCGVGNCGVGNCGVGNCGDVGCGGVFLSTLSLSKLSKYNNFH